LKHIYSALQLDLYTVFESNLWGIETLFVLKFYQSFLLFESNLWGIETSRQPYLFI